jgi:hypothetical protein
MNNISFYIQHRENELQQIIRKGLDKGYSKTQILKINKQVLNNKNQQKMEHTEDTNKQNWATFTHFGNYIRSVTNLFKHTIIKIAFRTNNTTGNLLHTRNQIMD